MKHTRKLSAILGMMKKEVGNLSTTEAYYIVSHIARSLRGTKVKPLTDREKRVFDAFVREKINPSTVYIWFGFYRLDKDLQKDVERGRISFRRALLQVQSQRRKETKKGLEKEILGDIRKVINMLKEASNLGEVV